MTDPSVEISLPKLWLEAEAAELLRRAPTQVKRLRLAGKLGYYRGRPVTISQTDLEIYVAGARMRRVKARGDSNPFESPCAEPRPFVLLTIAEVAAKFERTPQQIRYLCLRGHVPYIPGRPPLIDETDIAEYFEKKRLSELAKIPPTPGTPEFEALQDRKAHERMTLALRTLATLRAMKRSLKE